MQCKDVMVTPVFCCEETDTVQRCAKVMREQELGFVPVVNEEGVVVGTVTDRDLAIRVLADARSAATQVREVMTVGPLLACQPEEELRTLEERMAREKRQRALVLDPQGRPMGVIGIADIAEAEVSASRTGRLMRELSERESAVRLDP